VRQRILVQPDIGPDMMGSQLNHLESMSLEGLKKTLEKNPTTINRKEYDFFLNRSKLFSDSRHIKFESGKQIVMKGDQMEYYIFSHAWMERQQPGIAHIKDVFDAVYSGKNKQNVVNSLLAEFRDLIVLRYNFGYITQITSTIWSTFLSNLSNSFNGNQYTLTLDLDYASISGLMSILKVAMKKDYLFWRDEEKSKKVVVNDSFHHREACF